MVLRTPGSGVKVITCISDPGQSGYQTFLRPSCAYHAHELVTLHHPGQWTSHRIKDHCLAGYLKGLDSPEVILFSDGYDAMLLAAEDEIMEKYHAFSKPLVFSAEINCWPYPALSTRYSSRNQRRPYLNCGGFIGRSDVILELLEKHPAAPSTYSAKQKREWAQEHSRTGKLSDPDVIFQWSNQYYWTHVFLQNQDRIALDHECSLFLTLSTSVDALREVYARPLPAEGIRRLSNEERQRMNLEFHFSADRLVRTSTGASPCHVHFNGPVAKDLASTGYFLPATPWQRAGRAMAS